MPIRPAGKCAGHTQRTPEPAGRPKQESAVAPFCRHPVAIGLSANILAVLAAKSVRPGMLNIEILQMLWHTGFEITEAQHRASRTFASDTCVNR
jgi:hypothetical protein